MSALREWMAEIGARGRIKVSVWGKYKTIMQIVGLSFLLFRQDLFGCPIYKLGLVLTGIAAVLTLWSMFLYLRLAWPELRGSAGGSGTGPRAPGEFAVGPGEICAPAQGFSRALRAARLDSRPVRPYNCASASRAGIAQLVERNLAKVEVASSSLVSRSKSFASRPISGRLCTIPIRW